MPAVEVIARNLHRGHIEKANTFHSQGGGTKGGDIRPVCDSCGWKGPKYAPADEPIAQVGLEAHIATADNGADNWLYEICIYGTGPLARSRTWDWVVLEWQ